MIDRYFIDSYGVESSDKLGKWVLYIDHQQALAEKDKAYQQLMVQAITLAEIVLQGHRHRVKTLRNASIILAGKLLNSPEAHAFLKEREGT